MYSFLNFQHFTLIVDIEMWPLLYKTIMNLINMFSFGLEISDNRGTSLFLQHRFEYIVSDTNFARGALLSTARTDILTEVVWKIQVFPDVTPCHQVNIY